MSHGWGSLQLAMHGLGLNRGSLVQLDVHDILHTVSVYCSSTSGMFSETFALIPPAATVQEGIQPGIPNARASLCEDAAC